jgi:hypothetical protein
LKTFVKRELKKNGQRSHCLVQVSFSTFVDRWKIVNRKVLTVKGKLPSTRIRGKKTIVPTLQMQYLHLLRITPTIRLLRNLWLKKFGSKVARYNFQTNSLFVNWTWETRKEIVAKNILCQNGYYLSSFQTAVYKFRFFY